MEEYIYGDTSKPQYAFKDLPVDTLLDVMVEGRNVSTRRAASIEYKTRIHNMENTIVDLQRRLAVCINKDNPIVIEHNRGKNIYMVEISNEVAMYNETDNKMALFTRENNKGFRGMLMALIYAINEWGNDINVYVNCEYITRTIKLNINKWTKNDYRTIDDKVVKNKDVMVALLEYGMDFNRVHPFSILHKNIVLYIKEVCRHSMLGINNLNITEVNLTDA